MTVTQSRSHMTDLIDLAPASGDLLEEARLALGRTPPQLPCKLLYDKTGSDLFDQICGLPEYYPTRTEAAIMQTNAPAIADSIGTDALVIELGSGSSTKTPLLLNAMRSPAGYVPVDISRECLIGSARRIGSAFPRLTVIPVCADYHQLVDLPSHLPEASRRVIYYPGSTIGNMHPPQAADFLRQLAQIAGRDGALLIGIDLKKDAGTLIPAYNDSRGVTARFNLNTLYRLKHELGATLQPEHFHHHAIWNARRSRIEMHLVAHRRTVIEISGQSFCFLPGQYIRSECSYKHTAERFTRLAKGWRLRQTWTDPDRLFSVLLLTSSF